MSGPHIIGGVWRALVAVLVVSMSVEALTRVFAHSKATLGARLVLLALADYAHDDGTGAYPSVKKLAEKTRMSPRAVQYKLRLLERIGEIAATGRSKYGTTIYAIRLGGADSAGVARHGGASDDSPGVQSTTAGVKRPSPNPSLNPPVELSDSSSAREPAFDKELPEDFPDELRSALEAVWPVIERIAEKKGAEAPPSRAAVARAIASFPDHDHHDAATDLEHWRGHRPGRPTQIADVVQSYRRTLARTRRTERAAAAPAASPRRDFSRFDRAVRQ